MLASLLDSFLRRYNYRLVLMRERLMGAVSANAEEPNPQRGCMIVGVSFFYKKKQNKTEGSTLLEAKLSPETVGATANSITLNRRNVART